MNGRPFAFLSALSLAACLVISSLWARGRFRTDFVGSERLGVLGGVAINDRTGLWNGPDQITIAKLVFHTVRPNDIAVVARYPTINSGLHHSYGYNDSFFDHLAGFRSLHNTNPPLVPPAIYVTDGFTISHKWLVVWTAILPLMWIAGSVGRRQENRWRAGLCAACGYDLRATPDRCPECGTFPAKALASG
jgi:hypothetical protein